MRHSKKKQNYLDSKTGLAKLLANENLHLVHDPKAKTAYIDLTNRVITLPILQQMSGPMYNAMICHEVSHAIHTPQDGWNKFCDEYPAVFLNVTEDVRIERLIQAKYPGSKKDFYELYKELHARDFFGMGKRKSDEYTVLDKLNLHFKIGRFTMIRFDSGKETYFKQKLDRISTFEESRDLAIEIYEYMKDRDEVDDVSSEIDLVFADSDSDPDRSENQKGNQSKKQQATIETSKDIKPGNKKMPAGVTREKQNENTENQLFKYDANGKSFFGDVYNARKNYKRYIVDGDSVNTRLSKVKFNSGLGNSYGEFMRFTKPVIAAMVSRFNMKKSAIEYKKIQSYDTGKLNAKKISQFKVRDDIFLKSEIVKNAQNHGMVMVIDFSQSMTSYIKPTLEQVYILVEFCRKIGIPYEVYGFTDQRLSSDNVPPTEVFFDARGGWGSNAPVLYNILSSVDKTVVHKHKCEVMLDAAYKNSFSSKCFGMGCTPLIGTAFLMEHVVNDFKIKHNKEKISLILLSDGAGNDDLNKGHQHVHMRCKNTGKIYTIDKHGANPFHNIFHYVKDKTNLHSCLGFYLTKTYSRSTADYLCPETDLDHVTNDKLFDKNGFVTLPQSVAFDNFNIVNISNFAVAKNINNGIISDKKKFVFLNSFIDNIS